MRKIRVRVSGGVPYTPLVQWIERETSKLMMRVQSLQGVPMQRYPSGLRGGAATSVFMSSTLIRCSKKSDRLAIA